MTTKQKNYKFIEDLTYDLGRWAEEPTMLMKLASLVVVVTLVGGLFFWASQIGNTFGGHAERSQLELANSGLQTMRRMVGDEEVWSKSVAEEYERIFGNQALATQSVSYNYTENFIEPNHSIAPTPLNNTLRYSKVRN